MSNNKNNLDCIPVIDLTSSDYEVAESSQLPNPRRKVKRRLIKLLPRFNHVAKNPGVSQRVEEINLVSSESEDDEPNLDSISVPPNPQLNEVQTYQERHPTNFYKWLLTAVIIDDLSFQEPFINPAWDPNQLTERQLLLHAIDLYRNADQLTPQELIHLPFIPRCMCRGETMLDIPFLDPLLVVLQIIHMDELHWMLNVLPWRVLDRPIRAGRSILAWITDIGNVHEFLESTRAPFSFTVKIIRFLDSFFEK